MFFGLFVERNPQAEVVNQKFDEFITLLWKYKTENNVSMVILLALFGGMICSVFGGFIFVILTNDSEFIVFGYLFSGVLGTILSGVLAYNRSYGISNISVSIEGNYISADSKDGNVYFFNKGGKLIWKRGRFNHISISSDASHIAAGSQNKFNLFDVKGNLLWDFIYKIGWLVKYDGTVEGVSISTNSSYIAAIFNWNDTATTIYNIIFVFDRQGNRLWDYTMSYGTIIGVSVSSDGSSVTVVKEDDVLFFNIEGSSCGSTSKSRLKDVQFPQMGHIY